MPVAFSDHFAHVVEFLVPDNLSSIMSPKCRPSYRIRAEVIKDQVFKERLAASMQIADVGEGKGFSRQCGGG